MNELAIEPLHEEITLQRVIYKGKGDQATPSVIIIGGIHGNEKAGIYALHEVVKLIEKKNIKFHGNIYFLTGNINALHKNIRFQEKDLNRVWTSENIQKLKNSSTNNDAEYQEQQQLYDVIKQILLEDQGPFYFIDLHTTSSETTPFITISDSLNNRKFASNFCVPIVLGIEEYLDGPLLTYINEFGHVALGFEAGQHDDQKSVENCIAFIWLSLEVSGCLDAEQIKDHLGEFKSLLCSRTKTNDFYEIDYRYVINDDEEFRMLDGFVNFDKISIGQKLAITDAKQISSVMDGNIFMPLYQNQGEDGFFIITQISKFWLRLSIFVRKLKLDNILRILPGIRRDRANPWVLIVNPRTASFLTTEIFHLFGYRKQVIKDDKLHFIKRDRKIKSFN